MGNGKMMDFGKWEQGNKIDFKKKKKNKTLIGRYHVKFFGKA
jgi:hypothetical protein